jgi:hydrogenase expression/formation protein
MAKGLSDKKIVKRLIEEYCDYKDIDRKLAHKLAEGVLEECKKSDLEQVQDPFIKEVLDFEKADITVGRQGVGCRGAGDFFVHKLISEFCETSTEAFLSPKSLDDAGAVRLRDFHSLPQNLTEEDLIIVSKMEGIHSRLSDFPFICGFHVTRAALRDLYVKGAEPISICVDVHLGDDSDVGKLFDFMAGISAVCELAEVPLTAGSTLRIGGDMVIGNRLVGGIGGVGIASNSLFARRNIKPGDKILMTEGAGGGTISTTAIYSGNHEVVRNTMNITFLEACKIILNSDYKEGIHAMCDVTNGGLRGDLYEINYEADCGVTVFEKSIRHLVDNQVLKMLEKVGVDYLGVSLDALLIYCADNIADKIINDLGKVDIKCAEIGFVDQSKKVSIVFQDKKAKAILPKFRESAYTKIKQVIGEENPEDKKEMEEALEGTAKKALIKRQKIIKYIKNQKSST